MVSFHSSERAGRAFSTAGGRRPNFVATGFHVDALANSEQLLVAGEARQRLIDGGSFAQAKQGVRTERSTFGRLFS